MAQRKRRSGVGGEVIKCCLETLAGGQLDSVPAGCCLLPQGRGAQPLAPGVSCAGTGAGATAREWDGAGGQTRGLVFPEESAHSVSWLRAALT